MVVALVVVGFFMLTLLVTWSLLDGIGNEINRPSIPEEPARAHAVPLAMASAVMPKGRCLLCSQPLRREPRSSNDVVAEIERWINADTLAIARILQNPAPEALRQLYMN